MGGKRKRKTDPPANDTVKRQRPDTRERIERNKGYDWCAVKCSLKSFCSEEASALPWENVLKDMNKAVAEAYILGNLHVLRLCQAGRPIPVLNQDFYYKCMSAVSVGLIARRQIANVDFRRSVEMYKLWRGHDMPFASSAYISNGWFQNASVQMATNASNHIVVNFYRRFQKYIKQRFHITGQERYQLLRDVLAPTYEGRDARVLEFRGWIPRNAEGWIDKKRPHLILPATYRFLQLIEAENDSHRHDPDFQQLRSFSLLPLKRGFECSHFKMCTVGLHALLKRAGTRVPPFESKGGPVWSDVADEWWRKLFDIDRFETDKRTFAGEILTDGKVVSIVLRKPKIPVVEEPAMSMKGNAGMHNFGEIWGLDPGRRDLFVATSNFGETLSCSSRKFYQDAKYYSSNRTTWHWMDHDPQVKEAIRNMPTRKTSSLQSLETYVRFLIPRLDLLLDFRMAKPFRKLRFRRFNMKKKKLHELCEMMTARAGSNTLIGYGDWSATDYGGLIKKCPGGPVKKLERELKHYCKVQSVPEYRTSKLHAECRRELTYQFAMHMCKDGVERRIKIYSVLHCRNSGCQGMTVNRDQNASKNMLVQTIFHLDYGSWHPAFTPRPRSVQR